MHVDSGVVWRAHTTDAGSASVRDLLADLLACAPNDLDIEVDTLGRPYLRGRPDVSFSLSRSGHGTLIGVSTVAVLGVDLEQVRRLHDVDGMVARYLDPTEQAVVRSSDDPHGAFLRFWVAKEAVLKGCGVGLRVEPREVLVGTGDVATPPGVAALRPGTPKRWRTHRLDLRLDGRDYAGAVAVAPVDVPVDGSAA